MPKRGGPSLHATIMKEVRDTSRMTPRPLSREAQALLCTVGNHQWRRWKRDYVFGIRWRSCVACGEYQSTRI